MAPLLPGTKPEMIRIFGVETVEARIFRASYSKPEHAIKILEAIPSREINSAPEHFRRAYDRLLTDNYSKLEGGVI